MKNTERLQNIFKCLQVLLLIAVAGLAGCSGGDIQTDSGPAKVEYRAADSDFYRRCFGSQLMNCKDLSAVGTDVLDGKTVGIYFAAQWNPACRYFTPRLIDCYRLMMASKKPFEIIFVSGDRTEEDMKSHIKELKMPWKAVAFECAGLRQSLVQQFGAFELPQLVVINETGDILSVEGVSDVSKWKHEAYKIWQ